MGDPTAALPALDLSEMRRLDADVSRAVLAVIAPGSEQLADVEYPGISAVDDDEPGRVSTMACGQDRRTLPLRKAREAWLLACERGLVPASWAEDPRRCFPDQELLFFCDECGGLGATGYNYDELCNACHGRGNAMRRGSVALPTMITEVRWMIGHPVLVEQAEALAREAVRRLGDAVPLSRTEKVQWGRVRIGKPLGTVPVVISSPIRDLAEPRPKAWDWDRMKGPAFAATPWFQHANFRQLDRLTRDILCFDVGMAWTHAAMGVEVSPFEPLLRLWELGVMIEELTAEVIVLERARHRYIKSWSAGVPYG